MVHIVKTIEQPIVTEKTVALTDKYVFRVHDDATKDSVKKAIKEFYGITVEKVNIIKTQPKTRTVKRGKTVTKKASFKKALVTVKKGETIDFNAFK